MEQIVERSVQRNVQRLMKLFKSSRSEMLYNDHSNGTHPGTQLKVLVLLIWMDQWTPVTIWDMSFF